MAIQRTTREQLVLDLGAVDFGVVQITPDQLAGYLEKYVHFGSKRYTLSRSDLTVYHLPLGQFIGKEKIDTKELNGEQVPTSLQGHLDLGTRFLDAVLYMHLKDNEKPATIAHPLPAATSKPIALQTYSDHVTIAKYLFFVYFYILTRAKAPSKSGPDASQAVPRFLASVLAISPAPSQIVDYLASFDINDLDPSWVKAIKFSGLSRESLSRFGLGVAGYRMAQPFKIMDPDGSEAKHFEEAIDVAKSFAVEPACWDFHPATRHPDVLTKYGNLNKNLGNLILLVYTEVSIDAMVKARILFQKPIHEPNYTNYRTWTRKMLYRTSSAIFPSI